MNTRTPSRPRATVVGGGVAGLVAAIELARGGFDVTLYERQPHLGGLAITASGAYHTNIGPRALYTNNPLFAWLRDRRLLPALARPRFIDLRSFRFLEQSRARGFLPMLPATLRRVGRTPPPVGPSFRDWGSPRLGERTTERLVGLASLPMFHHDPGELSAHSVHRALRDAYLDGRVTYVRGGWAQLVATLERAARAAGVEIVTDADITTLPAGRTVLAIPMPAARRLLGDTAIDWPSAPTALLDVGLTTGQTRTAVFGLDTRVYAARYTRWDAGLAPHGHDLVQAQAGLRPGERLDTAIERIEQHLDDAFPTWRNDERWRHRAVMRHGAGPADPPGSTWRDRPVVARGDGIHLVNDRVAQPGLLSAVAVGAALHAGRTLVLER